jgi:molecular chaperone GrpE
MAKTFVNEHAKKNIMEENEVKENQEVKEENVSTNQECEEKETSSLSSKKKKKKDEKSNKELLKLQQEIENLTEKYKETNDKYLRLAAEFDNYKKRTLKENRSTEIWSETVLTNLLSILDDFERAENSIKNSNDIEGIKQGIDLINAKFHEFMKQQGIKEIESKNAEFNTDFHEAITRFPAPSDELKGKVIDVIQKGYMLHDKVIRFAKVVVGE